MLAHTEVASGGIHQSSLKSRMTFFLSFKLEIFFCDISELHDMDPSQKTGWKFTFESNEREVSLQRKCGPAGK